MADETVNVKVKFDAKTGELRRALVELSALKKLDNRFSSGRTIEQYAKSSSRSLANVSKSWKRSFDFIDAGVKMTGKLLSGFLKMSIKGVILEMGLLSATMIGVHGLFVAGQYVMKAYKGVMQLLAQGAAGLTVALATASAAIREQQAAMFAYRGTGAKQFGSAMNQTRMAMRNLQMDASLATLGVENLNKAYGTMSKTMNVVQINQSTNAIKALMDFGSAGQDPAKGLEQVAVVVAALSDKKKGISDVITEAKKLGPEMEKALKNANVRTKKDFEKLLFSGDLAKKGGVTGQFDAVNTTLISQLKSYMTLVRGTFADFGDGFLEPVKSAFQRIFNIITRDLSRILGTVKFTIGAEGYFDNFVNAIDKASNWMVRMIREYLPAAQGMFGRIGEWFSNFRKGWNLLLEKLRPLIDGARVLYKALEPIWEAIKRAASNMTLFRSLLIDNQGDMQDFGERIGTFIDKFSEFMGGLKKMFADMAPFINDMISGFTQVFEMLSKLLTGLSGKGLASALGPMFAFSVIGNKMSSVQGRFMPQLRTNNMQVQAGSVRIDGGAGPIGAPSLSSGARGGERLSSGATGSAGAVSAKAMGAGGAAALASGLSGFKSSGGNIISATPKAGKGLENYTPVGTIRGLHTTKEGRRMTFGESAAYGRQMINSRSNIPEVIAANRERIEFLRNRTDVDPYLPIPGAPAPMLPPIPADPEKEIRKLRAKNMGLGAAYRVRSGIGAYLGGLEYLRGGMINPETGESIDIGSQRQAIINRYAGLDADGNPLDRPERGRFGRGLDRINRARDLNRLYRTQSRFGNAYNNQFAKSVSGRMGASMGLGILSQYAPEEMRGAMALGGMAAQIDPRLGIAVAGVGGAMQARGAGRGALSGAAGGAAVGAMFGPQGALVGAAIGGVFGAIRGAVNKGNHEMKMAKAAAAAGLSSLYSSIADSASLELDANRKKLESGELSTTATGTTVGIGSKMLAGKSRITRMLGRLTPAEYDARFGPGKRPDDYEARDKFDLAEGIAGGRTSSKYINWSTGNILPKNVQKAIGGSDENKDLAKYILDNASQYRLSLTDTQKSDALKNPTAFLDGLRGSVEEDRQLLRLDDIYKKRLDALSKATGKSGAEIEVLAQKFNIDLASATTSYGTILDQFTEKLMMNKDQINNALSDVLINAANPYRQERETKQGELALDAIGKKMFDISKGRGTKASKMGAINAQMEQLLPSLLAASGGDAMKAISAYTRMFIDGEAFKEGEALSGMKGFFGTDNEAFQKSTNMILTGTAGVSGTQIRTRLAGQNLGIDQDVLETAIKNMPADKQAQFLKDMANFSEDTTMATGVGGRLVIKETNKLKSVLNTGNAEAIEKFFKEQYGADINVEKTQTAHLDTIAKLSQDQVNKIDGLASAIKSYEATMRQALGLPEPPPQTPGNDTRTPRGSRIGDTSTSKLSQTMARHADMDGQLSGKRTVTSSLRNHALGSINSDHATGSAYDLTGQNLGMYAKLVHQNGGFAEFHGTLGRRHLHVVPGPGPVGDTTTIRRAGSRPASGGDTITNYYTFEISGGDAETIANRVMEKIKQQERSNRERS